MATNPKAPVDKAAHDRLDALHARLNRLESTPTPADPEPPTAAPDPAVRMLEARVAELERVVAALAPVVAVVEERTARAPGRRDAPSIAVTPTPIQGRRDRRAEWEAARRAERVKAP